MKANTLIKETKKSADGEISRTYRIGRYLGKGGSARVYELICLETSTRSAAKIIPKSTVHKPGMLHKLMTEISIHKSLYHENIVKFEHVFEDGTNI